MSILINIVVFFIPIIIAALYYVRKLLSHFDHSGAPVVKPSFPMGSIKTIGKEHISISIKRLYDEYKSQGPYAGAFLFIMPCAILIDLELIKAVCIKDFDKFQDKGLFYNEKDEPLTAHLFSIDGPKWKLLRHKLSPTFTSGKMKIMFGTVVEVAEKFRGKLIQLCETGKPIDVNDVLARFTTDVIGSCAFGIESNSLDDENSIFRKMGRKVFQETRHGIAGQLLMTAFPNVAKKFRMKENFDEVNDFFLNIVRDTIELRKREKITRNDFMNLLINMMQKDGENKDENLFTFEEIAAQAFIFYVAGFETSSSLLTFCLYELSIHTEIQEKLRQEVNDVLAQHDGKMTYDAVMEMKYMDQVLNETLRKHPTVSETVRKNHLNYSVAGTNIIIPKDTMVLISVYSIHHDPEYYPDPEKFDPERFTPENIQKRPSCSFMPFGEGPRNCIGLRFGLMQAKIGLAVLLTTMKTTLSEKTKVPLEISPRSGLRAPLYPVYLKTTKI